METRRNRTPKKIMVPTLFQIQNSRTFQGPSKDFSIFFKDLFVHVKKWFADFTDEFRPEGMKNGNIGVFINLSIKFQTMHISKITILYKI